MKLPRSIRFFRYLTWPVIRTIVRQIWEQRLNGLAAEMAYGSMLALFPTILALLTAIGLFEETLHLWVRELASPWVWAEDQSLQLILQTLAAQLRIAIPELMWTLLSNFVAEVTERKNGSLFSISFVAAIWIASSAVCTAMNALDQIHRVPRKLRRSFWQARGIAILLTIATLLLLSGAAFFVLIGNHLINEMALFIETFPRYPSKQGAYWLLRLWGRLGLPFVFSWVILAFILMYRLGPSRWQHGTPVLPGAVLGAISWFGSAALFRFYVDNFGMYNRVYGIVGGFMVLMLWLYLSSLILLIGSQINVTVGREMLRRSPADAIAPLASEWVESHDSSPSGSSRRP